MTGKNNIKYVFICFLLFNMFCSFTSCDLIEFLKETSEEVKNTVYSYDDGLKNINYYPDTAQVNMLMSFPELEIVDYIKPNAEGNEKNISDSFDNKCKVIVYPAKNSKHTGKVVYIYVNLKYGEYYKEKLDCIFKDTKDFLRKYQSDCDQMFIVFRNPNKYIEWYLLRDNIQDTDKTLVFHEDYISYLKAAFTTYLSIKNKDYFYLCQIPPEVYDIDIQTSFTDKQLAAGDLQIQYKKNISSDIIDCLDYFTREFEFDYNVYPDEEKNGLTVIMYPDEGRNIEDNMINFWTELIKEISKNYDHYYLIREESKGGKVVHDIHDGEEREYKLDDEKWFS